MTGFFQAVLVVIVGEFEDVEAVEMEIVVEEDFGEEVVVVRFVDEFEEFDELVDFEVFQDVYAGDDLFGDGQFLENFDQVGGLVVFAVEDGDLVGFGAGGDEGLDLFGDAVVFGVFGFIDGQFEGSGRRFDLAVEGFVDSGDLGGEAGLVVGDDGAGRVEDSLLAAVIFDQSDYF